MGLGINTAPGIYYEHTETRRPTVSPLRTDITGFVGIAERGPLHQPVPIESWREFVNHFGGFIGAGLLAYSVRAFFENGGQRCWVVRVTDIAATKQASVVLANADEKSIWTVSASSPGLWGNALGVALIETNSAQTMSIPGSLPVDELPVESVSGFVRASLIRLSQPGEKFSWRVIEDIDAVNSKLIWNHKEPTFRSGYNFEPLSFDSRKPLLVESVEYNLKVTEAGNSVAYYEKISLIPEHPNYGPRILGPKKYPEAYEFTERRVDTPPPIVIKESRNEIKADDSERLMWRGNGLASSAEVLLKNGLDGLSTVTPQMFIGECLPNDSRRDENPEKCTGMKVLEAVDEISLLSIPDIHIRPIKRATSVPSRIPPDPCSLDAVPGSEVIVTHVANRDAPQEFSKSDILKVQQAMIDHCEKSMDRIALLDPPWSSAHDINIGPGEIQAWKSRFQSSYAMLYYPWIHVLDPLRHRLSLTRVIPPSGHVAGQIANTDLMRGVHKAPANIPLSWAQDLSVHVDEKIHGIMNETGVNLLRVQRGRGIRILGARTAALDKQLRFANVRRLLIMVKEYIYQSIQPVVFEPNNFSTRTELFLSLNRLMLYLWEQGALAGNLVEEAYRVKCDEENNPVNERDRGRLLAQVWLAPVKPFEFVLIQVGRSENAIEVAEVAK